jgi:hypothetical protein
VLFSNDAEVAEKHGLGSDGMRLKICYLKQWRESSCEFGRLDLCCAACARLHQ